MTPMHYQSIREVSARLRAASLSPVELTEHMLGRIEEIDGRLRSYATVMAEHARAQAAEAEREIAKGDFRGPLHGVPLAVKDLCFTEGVATMGGTAVLRDHVPSFDSTVVERLAAAGAVLLGKLNLTEGAMGGYNPDFGVPENPWRASHWPGASSSGSGAATAAGIAFGTLGSDTGGSIRHPAAVCGTVGLKPTWGLVSRHGVLDLAQSLDHVGPLTRTVEDAALMLQAIAGQDENDPTTHQTVVPDLTADMGLGVDGLKIGWDERYSSIDVADDFAAAVETGLKVLEKLGAKVVPVEMPSRLREYLEAWQVLCTSEAYDAHRAFYPERAAEYGPWFREWLERGASYSAADYAHAHHLRLACVGELGATLSDVDMFVCPSTAREAYPMALEDAYGPIPPDRDSWTSRYTVPMDYAGIPTLSIPCGLSVRGLPLSLQLVGRACSEVQLVRAGYAYERETEWHTLHPPGW